MLNNRGEAIDFLHDTYPDGADIVTELPGKPLDGNSVWLYKPKIDDFGSEEGVTHWLVEDGTVVITTPGTGLKEAYLRIKGVARASEDERLVEVVKMVANTSDYPLDYDHISSILDVIETEYSLKPIDVVRAYNMCERKVEIASLEEAVNG